ncbi:helix-turn-helix transcriptional regulator [Clostridium sp.]|uniref:helix-turn-helix domain-containing protein n=1 Tax=Clostridium sp. TaxID=1506 RepID=UPI00284A4EB7|nr:helix-turn-helix transcriptional regulator [Clostridium sp.]MDR3594159.1 helix-turn-helix transcriptional regulator [Clostridium sp.]
MNIDYTVIGKRIKQARKENNKTQENLAEHLEVSNSYISRIERGTTKLSLELLVRICTYLNIDPSYVLTGSISSSHDYLRNDIVDMLNGCSSEKIKLITEVIKPIIKYNK